ncbi:UDP-2,3-diacylglucosamine diphosphatase [Oxalobacteraceae bacterium R-40]|uniref:UDP-2,3-diacylglucosamine hydrolase n=1 Tax=Keguizhuia sedimenti TaxID=3064264 RepID=A0ABU1BQC4_9BURK|nr:UDP-2,3-diacylglucosamine diphosphatase [Oxalobacteraceae bacterium R-40]
MDTGVTGTSATDVADEQTAQPRSLALFASDIHLHPALPKTTQAFFSFLNHHACRTERLYLLGDLFEFWAGDDDLQTPFNQQVASEIRKAADAGVAVFWIAGNRDFLIGEKFASEAKLTLLPDPFVALIGKHEVVLTHGDALCTDDTSYLKFRSQVRNQAWQDAFLSKPLDERKSIIEGMRTDSKKSQRMKSSEIMDASTQAIADLFHETKASVMIHGHTHRPAKHSIELEGQQCHRFVLPDWDCDTLPERGGWIGVDLAGTISRYDLAGQGTVELQA